MNELFSAFVSVKRKQKEVVEATLYKDIDHASLVVNFKGETFKIIISKDKSNGNHND